MFGDDAFGAALRDLAWGVRLTPLWWRVGIEQTVTRYRRTVLGPFWLASSTLATGFALSVVFGAIFGGNWRDTFPFVLGGVTSWFLVGGMVVEGSNTFIQASGLMQVQRLPLSFHSFLQMDRLVINLAHQVVAYWLVTLALGLFAIPHWQLILALPLVVAIGFFLSIPIGMLAARYRDIAYMVGFVMQALFMLTPVFWRRGQMHTKIAWIVDYNPFAHLLEILRQPFLGHPAAAQDWLAAIALLVAAMAAALISLVAYRRRVVFWL